MNGHKHTLHKAALPLSIIAITVLGFVLRLQTLHLGLWRDEIWTLQFAQASSLADLVKAMMFTDYNPPAYYLLMHIYCTIFGTSETAMVFPSIVFGTLAIPATAWLASSFRSRYVTILAPFFLAITPEAIYFSNQARNQILLSLLVCIELVFFLRALQADADGAQRRRNLWLAAFALMLVPTLYTSFTGALAMVALAFAFLLVRLFLDRRLPGVPYALSFIVPGLTFLFWLPIFLAQQKVGVPWWEKNTSLLMYPLVFSSNLSCLFPLPFPASYFVSTILLIAVLSTIAWKTIRLLRSETGGIGQMVARLSADQTARFRLILAIFLLVPISLFGYITGFQTGYFRYMAAFCPAGSVALALLWEHYIKQPAQTAQIWRKGINALAACSLVAMLIADTLYCISAGTTPKSGFRAMAQDTKDGKYDQSVIVVAPDAAGLTYLYYLDRYSVDPSKYEVFGFVLRKPVPIPCDTYPQAWQDERAVPGIMALIDKTLREKGWRKVVLAQDNYQPDTKKVPAKKRILELFEALKDTYDIKDTTTYSGEQEAPTITTFELKKR